MTTKIRILVTILIVLIASIVAVNITLAAVSQEKSRELIERHAPILYFHSDEIFRPQPVEVLVNESRLRKNRNNWFDVNVLNSVTLADLLGLQEEDLFLDVWYGSAGESDYKNYSAHRAYYQENLSPGVGGPPISIYSRLIEDATNQKIVIQYWLFYYYNDWFNKHEGDWELVQIILDYDQNPEWVVLSQHHGGTRRTWETTQIENGSHPKVYVALGSHANYFWGDEIYPNGMDIGNTRVEILDKTGSADKILPTILELPDITGTDVNVEAPSWLNFLGSWGEQAFQKDFGGPIGPVQKGDQWKDPYTWGVSQPLDIEVWYQNRLKVRVEEEAEISIKLLNNENIPETVVDTGNGFFILHTEQIENANWVFDIQADADFLSKVLLNLPISEQEIIQSYKFSDLPVDGNYKVNLIVPSDDQPTVLIRDNIEISPDIVEILTANWENPELVWIVGYLSTSQVVIGVIVSLAAGILPALLYVFLVYNFDKNEKEPVALISIALLWGAIPAVLVALVVNLFFQIPPDLLGPSAIEAVQTGLFSPLIEEALKGIIVVVIAMRYKKDFNNLLDGIIYGAMVGLGFAMTGNTLSYLSTFLFRGFSSLQFTIFVEGILFGLNHALYSSIFGAGIGYSLGRKGKVSRILISACAFLLAVLVNGVHSYFTESWLGITPLVVIFHWLGIGVVFGIMVLSRRHEEKVMRDYLIDVLPEDFYMLATSKKKRNEYFKAIKQNFNREHYKAIKSQFQSAAKLAFLIYQSQFNEDAALEKEINSIKAKLNQNELPIVNFE